MVVADLAVPCRTRAAVTCPDQDPGYRKARQFVGRARRFLEGYFTQRNREQLTLLARFIRRYFREQWEMEWMRDEIEARSKDRTYDVIRSRWDGTTEAAISFLDHRRYTIAILRIRFAPDGSVKRKHFQFIDRV